MLQSRRKGARKLKAQRKVQEPAEAGKLVEGHEGDMGPVKAGTGAVCFACNCATILDFGLLICVTGIITPRGFVRRPEDRPGAVSWRRFRFLCRSAEPPGAGSAGSAAGCREACVPSHPAVPLQWEPPPAPRRDRKPAVPPFSAAFWSLGSACLRGIKVCSADPGVSCPSSRGHHTHAWPEPDTLLTGEEGEVARPCSVA